MLTKCRLTITKQPQFHPKELGAAGTHGRVLFTYAAGPSFLHSNTFISPLEAYRRATMCEVFVIVPCSFVMAMQ